MWPFTRTRQPTGIQAQSVDFVDGVAIIDVRGQTCPGYLLAINRAVEKLPAGTPAQLLITYPPCGDECKREDIWVWKNTVSPEEWDSLVTAGTTLNSQWRAQADKVAWYLKQLREAHIPVLWRPYHEMNGVWFWWCQQPGRQGFARLWNMMYDYFTNHHQLNNLLWVWNANAPRDIPGDEARSYADYFPGTGTVDILAADVYRQDWKQSHHDDLITLGQGKLIALGEVGTMPSADIVASQPQWCGSWNGLNCCTRRTILIRSAPSIMLPVP